MMPSPVHCPDGQLRECVDDARDCQHGVVIAQRIGDDIGQAADRFLAGAAGPARMAGGEVSQRVAGIANPLGNPACGGGVILGDVNGLLAKINQLIQRSPNLLHAALLRTAASAASSWSVASSCGMTRPAFISASPRWMPSMISSSLST